MEELTPITRREVFLAKASGQEVETPTPVTREEVFLDKIAKGGGSNKFIVTCTPTYETAMNGTTDKTGAELYQAYQEGKGIVFSLPYLGIFAYVSYVRVYDGTVVQPHAAIVFSTDGTNYLIGDLYTGQARIDVDDPLRYSIVPFTLTPAS